MVRAPGCEKMGLRKGPWSVEEDQILVSFIQKHGHGNWRALPKQAGLRRCGKSCRLRWMNYLRPDIKRGNLSREEEETIIELHEKLGNRWSAIAAKLPGRTDNEIKNVWHTHIKKKLQPLQNFKGHKSFENPKTGPNDLENCNSDQSTNIVSEMSSVTESSIEKIIVKNEEMDYTSEYFPQIDESFWSEDSPNEDTNLSKWFIDEEIRFDSPPAEKNTENGTEFWHNIFIKAAEIPDLPDL